jgi:hypothetical protein
MYCHGFGYFLYEFFSLDTTHHFSLHKYWLTHTWVISNKPQIDVCKIFGDCFCVSAYQLLKNLRFYFLWQLFFSSVVLISSEFMFSMLMFFFFFFHHLSVSLHSARRALSRVFHSGLGGVLEILHSSMWEWNNV